MSSNNSSVPDHGQPGQENQNTGQAEESDGFFENGWQQPGNESVWNDPDAFFVMPHEVARATVNLEWRQHKPMIGTNGWLVEWMSSVTGTTVTFLANKAKPSGVPSSDVHIIGMLPGIASCINLIRMNSPITIIVRLPEGAPMEYLNESREDIKIILDTYGVNLTFLADGRLACSSIPSGCTSNVSGAIEVLSHLLDPSKTPVMTTDVEAGCVFTSGLIEALMEDIRSAEYMTSTTITLHEEEPEDFYSIYSLSCYQSSEVVTSGRVLRQELTRASPEPATIRPERLGVGETFVRIKGDLNNVMQAREMLIQALPIVMELTTPPDFYLNERVFLSGYQAQVESFSTHMDANLCGKTVTFSMRERDMSVMFTLASEIIYNAWQNIYIAHNQIYIGPDPASALAPATGYGPPPDGGSYGSYYPDEAGRDGAYGHQGEDYSGDDYNHHVMTAACYPGSMIETTPDAIIITPVYTVDQLTATGGRLVPVTDRRRFGEDHRQDYEDSRMFRQRPRPPIREYRYPRRRSPPRSRSSSPNRVPWHCRRYQRREFEPRGGEVSRYSDDYGGRGRYIRNAQQQAYEGRNRQVERYERRSGSAGPPRRFRYSDQSVWPPMPPPNRQEMFDGAVGGGQPTCTYILSTEVAEIENVEDRNGNEHNHVTVAWKNTTSTIGFSTSSAPPSGSGAFGHRYAPVAPAPTPMAVVVAAAAAIEQGHPPAINDLAVAAERCKRYQVSKAMGLARAVGRGRGRPMGRSFGPPDRLGESNERSRTFSENDGDREERDRRRTVSEGSSGGHLSDPGRFDHRRSRGGKGKVPEDPKARLADEIRDSIFCNTWRDRYLRRVRGNGQHPRSFGPPPLHDPARRGAGNFSPGRGLSRAYLPNGPHGAQGHSNNQGGTTPTKPIMPSNMDTGKEKPKVDEGKDNAGARGAGKLKSRKKHSFKGARKLGSSSGRDDELYDLLGAEDGNEEDDNACSGAQGVQAQRAADPTPSVENPEVLGEIRAETRPSIGKQGGGESEAVQKKLSCGKITAVHAAEIGSVAVEVGTDNDAVTVRKDVVAQNDQAVVELGDGAAGDANKVTDLTEEKDKEDEGKDENAEIRGTSDAEKASTDEKKKGKKGKGGGGGSSKKGKGKK